MDRAYLERLNPARLPSPCFVVDEAVLAANAAVLDGVQRRTGARILLALKGFATFATFGPLRGVLAGTCASGPYEARLGRETFGGEVHVASPAYTPEDIEELVVLGDHIVFNSFGQLRRFLPRVRAADRPIEVGIRINPEHSEGKVAIYDPCNAGSRLGVRRKDFAAEMLADIDGLHFHSLCEHNADALARTLEAVEEKFGAFLSRLKWLNMGGGHHITRADYDIDLLCDCIERVKTRYGVRVYLEPGEAVALNAGLLVASVLDVVPTDALPVAILDTSASCHMPDVLEMPYRPEVIGAGRTGEKAFSYRLAGKSCLAGDVIGDYSFDAALRPGDRLAFLDMAIYSMVKTNTFNGVPLPAIARYDSRTGALEVVRRFGYGDFKNRLS
jgi:carboxynorspermidine decarboxylase